MQCLTWGIVAEHACSNAFAGDIQKQHWNLAPSYRLLVTNLTIKIPDLKFLISCPFNCPNKWLISVGFKIHIIIKEGLRPKYHLIFYRCKVNLNIWISCQNNLMHFIIS